MSENIIQRIARKIRPGSGGPAKAISIVDGATGRAPSISPIRRGDAEEDFDDVKSGAPMALSSHFGVGPEIASLPVGPLPGIDKEGNIPPYAPDNADVLYRLFGIRGMLDE